MICNIKTVHIAGW